uniref:Holo-[acyl-carrier-protein] synthase n=1 Tax=uncultured bacterium contig00007 TaxID=1181499 RepID=A0A806K280_9BACT|nr:holo-[acyl-carrier protein] synthase [uncultured bacterium contig00007]
MITGIGIDVVQVKRMEHWLGNAGILERYFHPAELEYVSSRGDGAALSLAARFAAKEAFGKALGIGFTNITLKDIMVSNNQIGRPEIKLFFSAQEALKRSGADTVHVSLTHEKDNAIAMVVLERV